MPTARKPAAPTKPEAERASVKWLSQSTGTVDDANLSLLRASMLLEAAMHFRFSGAEDDGDRLDMALSMLRDEINRLIPLVNKL